MYIKNTDEWWKLKIYDEVSEFLKKPTERHHNRLLSSLSTYSAFYQANIPAVATDSDIDEYEQLMSN